MNSGHRYRNRRDSVHGQASRFDWLPGMDDGKVTAHGAPKEILAQAQKSTLDEAFIAAATGKARPASGSRRAPAYGKRRQDTGDRGGRAVWKMKEDLSGPYPGFCLRRTGRI